MPEALSLPEQTLPGTVATLAVDIGPLLPDGEPITLVADVHVPPRPARYPALLFCTPGGGVARGYFNLDGGPGTTFSFARAMTAAGHYVVAIDPVGVGESTRPVDGFALTTELVAEANRRLLAELRHRIAAGTFIPGAPTGMKILGVGHSAGALVTIVGQAASREFDALMLFCCSEAGLPEQLDAEQLAALDTPDRGRSRFAEFARRRFNGEAYLPVNARDSDAPAARALRAVHDRVIATVGIHAMTPGSVREEMAMIDVPVFLAVGDRDITGPPHLLAQRYERCGDLTLIVVETSGHHVFVAARAAQLYRRIADWLEPMMRNLNEHAD